MRCRRPAGNDELLADLDEVGIDDVIGRCQRIYRHAILPGNLGQRHTGLYDVDGLDRIWAGTHGMGG